MSLDIKTGIETFDIWTGIETQKTGWDPCDQDSRETACSSLLRSRKL